MKASEIVFLSVTVFRYGSSQSTTTVQVPFLGIDVDRPGSMVYDMPALFKPLIICPNLVSIREAGMGLG